MVTAHQLAAVRQRLAHRVSHEPWPHRQRVKLAGLLLLAEVAADYLDEPWAQE
jgi:hypothetical protein